MKQEGQECDDRDAECRSRKMREAGRQTGLEGENQQEHGPVRHGPATLLRA